MILNNFIIRIFTSLLLLLFLYFIFHNKFLMIFSMIIILIITNIEFNNLLLKINFFKKKTLKILLFRAIFFLYLLCFVLIISYVFFNEIPYLKFVIIYCTLISIISDIGGYVVGNILKGKKLTSISPNKTISGSLGSIFFSSLLIPFFDENFINLSSYVIFLFTIVISIISQLGDLFISFLKRLAKVKDTGNLLPGHGGLLDRIDGLIFAIPLGFIIINYFS